MTDAGKLQCSRVKDWAFQPISDLKNLLRGCFVCLPLAAQHSEHIGKRRIKDLKPGLDESESKRMGNDTL